MSNGVMEGGRAFAPFDGTRHHCGWYDYGFNDLSSANYVVYCGRGINGLSNNLTIGIMKWSAYSACMRGWIIDASSRLWASTMYE